MQQYCWCQTKIFIALVSIFKVVCTFFNTKTAKVQKENYTKTKRGVATHLISGISNWVNWAGHDS